MSRPWSYVLVKSYSIFGKSSTFHYVLILSAFSVLLVEIIHPPAIFDEARLLIRHTATEAGESVLADVVKDFRELRACVACILFT